MALQLDKRASGSVHGHSAGGIVRREHGVTLGTEPLTPPSEVARSGPDDRLLRVGEVAGLLAVSPRTVRRLATAGGLPAPLKVGGATRWRQSDVRAFIAGRKPHGRLTEAERG